MGWIAGKRQRVKRNGEYVWVNPGDPIPEAEHWINRSSWERQGYIRSTKTPLEVKPHRTNALTKKRRKPKQYKEILPPIKAGPVEAETETSEEALSGPGTCPDCGKDFLRLGKHKCKKAEE